MNPRERYLQTLLFGCPDKIPFEPGFPREKTLKRWREEGLPSNQNWFESLCKSIGISYPKDDSLQLNVNFRMIPTFEEKVLEHKNGHYIVQDWMGNIVEISDEYDYTYIRNPKDFVTRKWHKFPVSNRKDFGEMKRRYNPEDPLRFPPNFTDMVRKIKNRDTRTFVVFPGPFWQLREWCGFEPLCMMFIEDPDFIREMIAFWSDYVSGILSRLYDSFVPDCINISEDMAYKAKCMISPEMTREFLFPTWSRWIIQAKQAGVRILDMDSDGNIDELIPLWIEAGFNVCDPIEVAAGCDINEYRTHFGRAMAYRGGIDKRCIAKGGKVIEEEISRIAPVVKGSGFIPGCDHAVPWDVSWENFVHYAKLLADLTGWL